MVKNHQTQPFAQIWSGSLLCWTTPGDQAAHAVKKGFIFQVCEFSGIQKDAMAGQTLLKPDVMLTQIFGFEHFSMAFWTVDVVNSIKLTANTGVANIKDRFRHPFVLHFFQRIRFYPQA